MRERAPLASRSPARPLKDHTSVVYAHGARHIFSSSAGPLNHSMSGYNTGYIYIIFRMIWDIKGVIISIIRAWCYCLKSEDL